MTTTVILVASPVDADVSERDEGPLIAGGLAYTVGHGGTVEGLHLGWRFEAGLFLRIGRWQLTASAPWHPTITSDHPDRDGSDLFGIGLGGRLAYQLPVGGHGRISLAAGLTRRWVSSSTAVQLTCSATRSCLAGFYTDTPSYHAWAPQLRIGIGPEGYPESMVVGASFEIIIEAIGLHDVPPAGIRNVAVMAGATFTIGGGSRRRARPERRRPLEGGATRSVD